MVTLLACRSRSGLVPLATRLRIGVQDLEANIAANILAAKIIFDPAT
jgi:hypothetical protein